MNGFGASIDFSIQVDIDGRGDSFEMAAILAGNNSPRLDPVAKAFEGETTTEVALGTFRSRQQRNVSIGSGADAAFKPLNRPLSARRGRVCLWNFP